MPNPSIGFILTSSRDESPDRDTLLPAFYEEEGIKLLYPKDSLAGGTWIGASDKKRLICLLNGGFVPHKREENYRMSRGILVTQLLFADNAVTAIEDFNFIGIEPFTLILVGWEETVLLSELVWDGHQPYFFEKTFETLYLVFFFVV